MEQNLITIDVILDNYYWFSRGAAQPFDPVIQKSMKDTMIGIASTMDAAFAFCIKDTITLVFAPDKYPDSKKSFENPVSFITHISSMATIIFNRSYSKRICAIKDNPFITEQQMKAYKRKENFGMFICRTREFIDDIEFLLALIELRGMDHTNRIIESKGYTVLNQCLAESRYGVYCVRCDTPASKPTKNHRNNGNHLKWNKGTLLDACVNKEEFISALKNACLVAQGIEEF